MSSDYPVSADMYDPYDGVQDFTYCRVSLNSAEIIFADRNLSRAEIIQRIAEGYRRPTINLETPLDMPTRELRNDRGELVAVAYFDEGRPIRLEERSSYPVSSSNTHRMGRFRVSRDLIDSNWRRVAATLTGMLIVRAECRYDIDGIEYTAYCEEFDEVSKTEEPPFYRCIITVEEDTNSLFVEWQREGLR
jgi:hypothetical protein